MVGPGIAVAPRRAAVIVWSAMLVGLVVFLVVAAAVGPTMRDRGVDAGLAEVLLPLLAFVAAGSLVASRLVPRFLKVAGPMAGQAALPRQIMACALCDGGAVFAVVVWMVTGSPLALALLLLPLGGLVACWPGDARWAALGGGATAGAPRGFRPPTAPPR
jgi:hypothetical protein